MASDCFALAVLVCDEYLDADMSQETDGSAHHFFWIVSQLPMDLQMVMCNRLYGLHRDVVTPSMVETSLRRVLWFHYFDKQNKGRTLTTC